MYNNYCICDTDVYIISLYRWGWSSEWGWHQKPRICRPVLTVYRLLRPYLMRERNAGLRYVKLQCRFLDLCEFKMLGLQHFVSNCELISSSLRLFVSGFVDPESLWYLLLQQDTTWEIPPHGHLDIWSRTQHLSSNN